LVFVRKPSARVGWFTVAPHPYVDGFRRGMRELGWIEGENLLIEYIYADGHPERLPDLAAALVGGANDLSVASGPMRSTRHAHRFRSIPIVGISSTMGLSGNLARSFFVGTYSESCGATATPPQS
jgi:putative tryptophan/tyrosine transport system substrate-binding protein